LGCARIFRYCQNAVGNGARFHRAQHPRRATRGNRQSGIRSKFYGSEQNALDKRFGFWTSKAPLRDIVGIAKNGLYLNLYEAPRPYIYLPEYQLYQSGMMLFDTRIRPSTCQPSLKACAEKSRNWTPGCLGGGGASLS